MTNESISGFLNSIAEAKRAFDQEPAYIRQIQDLEADKKRLGDTVAHRELRIHELKQAEETLTQKLRSVEAERDDAGFRALEETDKVQGLLSVVHSIINDALKTISAVEGYEQIVVNKADIDVKERELSELRWEAAELKAELQRLKDEMRTATEQLQRPFNPEGSDTSSSVEGTTDPYFKPYEWPNDPPAAPSKGPSEVGPTVSTTQTAPSPSAHSAESQDTAPITTSASVEGQSEGPFASKSTTGNIPEPATVSSISAESETSAASNDLPPERNRDRSTFFKGRKYFDVSYYVPLHQWLNEGGTHEDYHWRPADANVALPQPNRASHNS